MDKVQKTAFTDYKAQSSEPFRLHLFMLFENVSPIDVPLGLTVQVDPTPF
jgi:hypothetical protein